MSQPFRKFNKTNSQLSHQIIERIKKITTYTSLVFSDPKTESRLNS